MENNNQKNILHIRDHHVIMKPMKSQYFWPESLGFSPFRSLEEAAKTSGQLLICGQRVLVRFDLQVDFLSSDDTDKNLWTQPARWQPTFWVKEVNVPTVFPLRRLFTSHRSLPVETCFAISSRFFFIFRQVFVLYNSDNHSHIFLIC